MGVLIKKTILNLYKKLGVNSRQYFLNLKFIHCSKIKNTLDKTLVGKNLKKRLHQLKIFSSRIKVLGRFRRFYKHKLTLLNSKYVDIFHNLKNFGLKIYIRVRPNNIFCTLKNIKENKILLNKSSGMYGIKTSKNKLKYNIKIILQFFFKEITNFLKFEKNILIELIAGIKI